MRRRSVASPTTDANSQKWNASGRSGRKDLPVRRRKVGVVAPPRAFGFHTFRRTLASVLVKMKVDVKTVQELLRHQNLRTTLELYAKSMSEDRLKAQGMFLELLLKCGGQGRS